MYIFIEMFDTIIKFYDLVLYIESNCNDTSGTDGRLVNRREKQHTRIDARYRNMENS